MIEGVEFLLKDLFKTKPKYITVRRERPAPKPAESPVAERREVQGGLWEKCPRCAQIAFKKELVKNENLCPKCDFHFRIGARERLRLLIDKDSFQEFNAKLRTVNVLNFPDYDNKLKRSQKSTDLIEAVITGFARLDAMPVVIAVIDFGFLGGSMGSVVGEKVTRAIEEAIRSEMPLIIISAGGGGARMHEGILSLMQMAKTSQALNKLTEVGCLYISVLTDPTMGGIFASFASLGDITIAEPDALIGFAGPRVIQQTIRQTLPPGFQTSQFLLDHGIIDMIVSRKELKTTLARLLKLHRGGGVWDGR
jgi:acetyl-CoA carboxylase carboxyl transferase subunit beta